MKQSSVEVTVANRNLKIACPVGAESALLSAAAEVNLNIEKVNKSKTITSLEQATIMTALNLANELAKVKLQLKQERLETKSKIQLLQSTIEQALNNSSSEKA